jgi:hypothetical protein
MGRPARIILPIETSFEDLARAMVQPIKKLEVKKPVKKKAEQKKSAKGKKNG